MPWYNGDYPPSYKNQPKKIRDKATEIANEVLKSTGNEGEAIATGLKQARVHFKNEEKRKEIMTMTDEEFREEYKPIQVPSHYEGADTLQHKMIFALAQIGAGTAEEVIAELKRLEPGIGSEQTSTFVTAMLASLFEHGHITGSEKAGRMHYNLSKITQANDGATDIDLPTQGH